MEKPASVSAPDEVVDGHRFVNQTGDVHCFIGIGRPTALRRFKLRSGFRDRV